MTKYLFGSGLHQQIISSRAVHTLLVSVSMCYGEIMLTEILIQFLAPMLVAHPFKGITCQLSDRSPKLLSLRFSHSWHEGN